MRESPSFRSKTVFQRNEGYNGVTGDITSTTESSQTYGAGSGGVCPYHRIYTSVQTPNYHELRRKGLLPLNAYMSQVITVEASPFSDDYLSKSSWYGNRTTNDWCATGYTFAPSQLGLDMGRTDATNRALLRAADKLSGVRVNLAQFFAERKQTAELFASTAHRVASAARALRRGHLGDFTRSLSLAGTEARSAASAWRRVERTPPSKRIASHWLEFVYGWKPLLSDVHDAAEFLAERINLERYPKGIIRVNAKVERNYPSFAGTYPRYDAHYDTQARYVLKYRMENEAKILLAQTGISNPMLLAWELLPYSFVVDWFVPVGTYLETLTSFDGFALVEGCLSTKVTGTLLGNFDRTVDNYWEKRTTSGQFFKREVLYQRVPLSNWPEYVVSVKSPIGGAPLQRFATAASLLRVLFR